ncbi:uncharacterized protein LOC114521026 [Dendronephthya gigantea]|uniref:uncharacterized protein LOC114521026 n=1 Tax=Dendronephthya gigantea TaxID=151771 RepID=UPI00106C7BB6|nr:uncharacterized protein LOC114521026 [Dendronephthya gigantea]
MAGSSIFVSSNKSRLNNVTLDDCVFRENIGLTGIITIIVAPVFGTLAAIFLLYAFHVLIRCKRGFLRPDISPYLQASVKTVFLGYVTLATVSISLIRCVPVAGKLRWFYNGNVASPHVCRSEDEHAEESENLSALKELLLGPYAQPNETSKRGALYWQSILIARRFILVVIFCVVTEPSIRLFCMTLACLFILWLHLKIKPFQNSFSNNLESISLMFLIVLALINLFRSVFSNSHQNIEGPLVPVFKAFKWLEVLTLGMFPAILVLLVCFAIISIFARFLFVCNDKEKEANDVKSPGQEMEETILKRSKVLRKLRHHKKNSH